MWTFHRARDQYLLFESNNIYLRNAWIINTQQDSDPPSAPLVGPILELKASLESTLTPALPSLQRSDGGETAGPTSAPDSLAVNITFDRARKHQPKHGTRAQAGQLALVCVNVCVWRCRCSLLSNRRASCRLLDRWRNTFNCTHLLPAWMFWAAQSASSSPHQTLSLIILNDGLVIRVFWIQFQKDKFTLI